jgi:hypothetical protein
VRKIIARPVPTSGNTDPPEITQGFSLTGNTILRAIRAVIIQYNDPTYTGITMKIYADRSGSPTKLIATSTNTVLPSAISAVEDHAFREVFFTFDDVPLRADVTYRAGLIFAGYTGTQASHLAWASSWPDPVYRTGLTILQADALRMPLSLTIIGSSI